jgi:hypothetical protein
MEAQEIADLLKATRKVPKSGKQRCFRLSLELDEKLQEIAEAATSITGYNVSIAHVARMIIDNHHMDILDAMTGRVQEIMETTMDDPDFYDDSEEDLEDTEDAPEEEDPKDPEEEYIKNLLEGSGPVTAAKWGD